VPLRDRHLVTAAGRAILPRRRGGLAWRRSFTSHLIITSHPDVMTLARWLTAVAQRATRCRVASLHPSMHTILPWPSDPGVGSFLSTVSIHLNIGFNLYLSLSARGAP
jgi:hypothetical protein